jgi:DEAD/DEAH box helicase domain-containing protein
VRRVETDYFTEAEVDTELRVLRREALRKRSRASAEAVPVDDAAIWRAEVHVTTLATQYKKIRYYTRENVGAEDIHLPPEEIDTEAFVLCLSDETAAELGLAEGDRGSAWHGLGNLLRRVAPLFLRCQPRDLGVSTQVRSPHFRRPALFLYDAVRGGVGLSELLFDGYQALFAAALDVVVHCGCTNGCPACVGPPEEVGNLGKETSRTVLEHLARGPELAPFPVEDAAPEEALAS